MRFNNSYQGLYVAFEGIVGTGKSTQIKLLRGYLERFYSDVVVTYTYEPGGTPKADEIRRRFKEEKLTGEQEVLLAAQAREDSLPVVGSALERGEMVVSDRFFLASLGYQGGGRELGWKYVWKKYNKEIVKNMIPDCVVFIDVPVQVARRRSAKDNPDKFDKEGFDFWERTRKTYNEVLFALKRQYSAINIIIIKDNGRLSKEEVHGLIIKELEPIINGWFVNGEGRIHREQQYSLKERLMR